MTNIQTAKVTPTTDISPAKKPEIISAPETALATCQEQDCDVVLETIDSCVGCVEGVDMQHQFEESLVARALQQRQIAKEHGLSEAEATMIRMQIASASGAGEKKSIEDALPDLDIFHICGNDEGDDDQACGGVMSPKDTTLAPTDDDPILDTTDQTIRSLVDVAEEEPGTDQIVDTDSLGNTHVQCAICFDETGTGLDGTSSAKRITFAYFPCCGWGGRDDASFIKVCTACILVLTSATTDGASRVGRCPRCRSWIAVSTLHSPNAGLSIRTLDATGECGSCKKEKEHLVEVDPSTCDECFLGRTPLFYECEQCHQRQKIAYPLYRYQSTGQTFGTATRECTGECKTETRWKICKDQLALIPAGDVPQEWGDDCLQLARARVQEARRGIAQLDVSRNTGNDTYDTDNGCYIL